MVKKKRNEEQPWVAVDIDHTITAAWWRDHLITPGMKDWDPYYKDQEKDPVNEEVVAMLRTLSSGGWGIAGLTAREEKYRAATTRYMVANEVPMDVLIMRPHMDFRNSPQLKLSILRLAFPGYQGIKLVIDDREDVCRAFHAAGIPCLQAWMVDRRAQG